MRSAAAILPHGPEARQAKHRARWHYCDAQCSECVPIADLTQAAAEMRYELPTITCTRHGEQSTPRPRPRPRLIASTARPCRSTVNAPVGALAAFRWLDDLMITLGATCPRPVSGELPSSVRKSESQFALACSASSIDSQHVCRNHVAQTHAALAFRYRMHVSSRMLCRRCRPYHANRRCTGSGPLPIEWSQSTLLSSDCRRASHMKESCSSDILVS